MTRTLAALLWLVPCVAYGAASGRVYDVKTGTFVQDARVSLYYDDSDAVEPGLLVPAARLPAGQQGQLTPAEGFYRFDPPAGRRYRIAVEAAPRYVFPSRVAPPRAELAPPGPVVPDAIPSPARRIYYLRFDGGVPGDVENNHLPLDPVADKLALTKHVDRAQAAVGDVFSYTVRVENHGDALTAVRIVDRLDAALHYVDVPGGRRTAGGAEWGPFDLATGATKSVTYTVAVGVAAVPGRAYDNRARLTSGAEIVLSDDAVARLRVVGDAFSEEGVILGRVMCGPRRRGAFGARVYADTGAAARADVGGAYHLSRVPPGVHLVKVDVATLPYGATIVGEAGKLVTLGRGLPARVDFAASCPELAEVAPQGIERAPDARPRPLRQTVTVAGDLALLTATVDGAALPLPAAELEMDRALLLPEATANFRPPDDTPLRFRATVRWPDGAGAPRAWTLRISQVLPVAREVRSLGGPGVPAEIAWDGLDEAGRPAPRGAVYEAQLWVAGDALSAAASARLRFGVIWGLPTPREITRTLRGAVAAELVRMAATLGPADRVSLDVHDDGSGDNLEKLAATAQQAQALRDALIATGVSAERIRAKGRGNLVPLGAGRGAADRQRNRRVVVVVSAVPRDPGAPIPLPEPTAPDALVGGVRVPVDGRGRFLHASPPPPDGRVVVDLVAADGRHAERVAKVTMGGVLKPPPATPPAATTLSGDVAAPALVAFGRRVDTAILGVDLGLRGVSGSSRRVTFAPVAPPGVAVLSWQLTVWPADPGESGEPVLLLAGAGAPPQTIVWDGRAPGDRFVFRLAVDGADGSRGESPLALVDLATPGFAQAAAGAMFLASGEPSATLRRQLTSFAAAVARRPVAERFRIEITAALPRVENAAEVRLARATRAGRVKAFLAAAGVPLDRVEVNVSAPPPARPTAERLFVTTATRVAPPPPEVRVGGRVVALTGTSFSTTVTLGAAGTVDVEVHTVDGRRGRFTVGAARPSGAISKLRDLKSPAPPEEGGAVDELAPEPETPAEEPTIDDVPVAGLRVRLPPRTAQLGAPELWVGGTAPRGVALRINGREAKLRTDGTFDELVDVPYGASVLVVDAVDRAGNRATLRWPVEFRHRSFLLVLAEGVAGNVRTAGMNEDSTVSSGDALFHGRVGVLYKGLHYIGGWIRELDLTVHLDTARQSDDQPFFEQLHDPTRDFPIFGDSAEETRESNVRGKLSIRVRADDSHATVGSFVARVGEAGDLVHYDRAVSGVELDADKTIGGVRHQARAFAATRDERVAHTVDVFRATGGALYYLRHARLIGGGERVRVIVRDRDNGRVLASRDLARDGGYTIDDARGRLLLKEPLVGTADAGSILGNPGAALAPLRGNPVYLEVGYDHEPDTAAGGAVAGVAVRERIGRFTVGGALLGEGHEGGDDYNLAGLSGEWRAAPHTRLRAEIARSSGVDAAHELSTDGGLSFGALGARGDGGQLAWRVELASALGDLSTARWAERTRVSLYAQELADGFRASGALLEQGQRKLGGVLAVRTGLRSEVTLRNDTATAGDDTSSISRLRWASDDRARLGLTLEAGHQHILDAERLGAAAQLSWRAARRLVLRVGQEVQAATGDDPVLDDAAAGLATSLAAEVELARDVFVGATGTLRWNGDSALQLGLRSPVDEQASIYAHERFEGRGGRLVASSVVGGEEHVAGGARAYGEYQIEHGIAAARNRAVLGVGRRFVAARGLRLAAGYEHQESDGGALPDGSPAGHLRRDVVHGAAELLAPERVKVAASVELRLDDSDGPVDVGGVLAPLVLPAGKRRQIVTGAAADWRWTRDQTFLARFRLADTRDRDTEIALARHLEATVGWALRPLALDWLDLLFRYSYLEDRRPLLGEEEVRISERSHVLMLAPLLALPRGVSIGGKLAWKRSARVLGDDGEVSTVDSFLAALRIGVRIAGRWEGAIEARALNLDLEETSESRVGFLLEAAYDIARFARIGAGYDFSRFSDDELADLERDGHGFFVRVVGRY